MSVIYLFIPILIFDCQVASHFPFNLYWNVTTLYTFQLALFHVKPMTYLLQIYSNWGKSGTCPF